MLFDEWVGGSKKRKMHVAHVLSNLSYSIKGARLIFVISTTVNYCPPRVYPPSLAERGHINAMIEMKGEIAFNILRSGMPHIGQSSYW